MCCRCHWPNTCMGCGQQLDWHHRWHCQMNGAWVTLEQCCELCLPDITILGDLIESLVVDWDDEKNH